MIEQTTINDEASNKVRAGAIWLYLTPDRRRLEQSVIDLVDEKHGVVLVLGEEDTGALIRVLANKFEEEGRDRRDSLDHSLWSGSGFQYLGPDSESPDRFLIRSGPITAFVKTE